MSASTRPRTTMSLLNAERRRLPMGLLSSVPLLIWSIVATAQTAAVPSDHNLGVGRGECSRLNAASRLRVAEPGLESVAATALQYHNWLLGWLTGFNVGTADAGLGAIELPDDGAWYVQVQHYCEDEPEALYGNVVRRFAHEIASFRRMRAVGSVAGLGRSDCSRLNDSAAREGQDASVAGFESWVYGFITGYNVLRAELGAATLKVEDESSAWRWVRARCAGNPSGNFNGTVALWVLDAEASQKLPAVPPDAGLAAYDETAPAPPRVRASRTSVGTGAESCDAVMSRLSADDVTRDAVERRAASWMNGYLSGGDALRVGENTERVNWAAVDLEQMWSSTKATCQAYPRAPFFEIVEAVEARLVTPSREPERTRSTSIGIGAEQCGQFRLAENTTLDFRDLARDTQYSVLSGEVLKAWIEGYFSRLNEAISKQIGVANALDLTSIGQQGSASAVAYCAAAGNETKFVANAVGAFAAEAYPEVFSPR